MKRDVSLEWLCSSKVMNLEKIKRKGEVRNIEVSFPVFFYDSKNKVEIKGISSIPFYSYQEGKRLEFTIELNFFTNNDKQRYIHHKKRMYFMFNSKRYKVKKRKSIKLLFEKNEKKIKLLFKF